MTKTKAELLEEIKVKEEEIRELKKETERLKRYEQYDEMTGEIKAMYDSFVRSGFTEEQAFKLLNTAIVNAFKSSRL